MLCNLLSVLVSAYDLSFVSLFSKVLLADIHYLFKYFSAQSGYTTIYNLYKAPHFLKVFLQFAFFTIIYST
jgi:hypothetical protein